MSKYKQCAVTVDSNTPPKYCCQDYTIRLAGDECAAVTMANMPGTPVLVFPTGDTDDTAVPHSTITDPVTVLSGPGVFTFDIDCDAIDQTEAPTDLDAQMQLCVCVYDKGENFEILNALQEICEKLVVSNDAMALAEIIAQLEALCAKQLELNSQIGDLIAEVQALCQKMLDALTAIGDQTAVLEAIKDCLTSMQAEIVAALVALCEKTDKTNELLDSLCGKINALIALLTTELTAILACLVVSKESQQALCDKVESVITDAPDCGGEVTGGTGGTPVGELYNYVNPETDTSFAVFADGSVSYQGGNPVPVVAQNYMDAINACLQAGNNALLTWVGPTGQVGSATALAASNPNPMTTTAGIVVTAIVGDVPMKWQSGTMQCVTADSPPEPVEGKVLGVYDACSLFCLKAIKDILTAAQNCTKPLAMKLSGITTTKCCTGGLTDATERCYTVYDSMLEGQASEGCTYTLPGGAVVESYTEADFLATLNDGYVVGPDVDGGKLIYASMGTSIGVTKRCYSGGIITNPDGDIVGTGSLVASISVAFSVPNTTVEECKDMLDVKEKNSEPIAGILAETLEWIKSLVDKQCDAGDDAALSSAKLCLIEEHLNPAGACPAPVVDLDKEAQTLTLKGDVTANYAAGQSINLQNANGEACGDATVAEGEGNVTLVDGNTVIKIVECELDEGKTPVQITQATPVPKPVKAAIKSIKTLQIKKTLVRKVAVKETR